MVGLKRTGVVMEIANLTKVYGSHVGVKSLNLMVHRGEIMGFLGPNGAGKTTTIRCCLNLIAKTEGRITILGLDSSKDAIAIRKRTGYLPGDFGLPPAKVKSFLRYLLSLSSCDSKKKMTALAERLDLDLERRTNELSKGNRVKVGIVQAIMADPELIIIDEPSGLDPIVELEFQRILREEKRQGKTIFLSSHDLSEVETVCDRVAIIKKGQLRVVERIQALREKTGKVLEVEFADRVNLKEFGIDGVKDIKQENSRVTMIIHQNLNSVVQALSNHRIINMSLKSYSLENLFLKYYSEEIGGGST
ncbi:MAG: ABC transporter ATP-binding protein [Candidatus Bathyarchaeota archaeon]|nr:ABC transporter ATP-binding protein [Candidatus Bathyarchaeota archaeon]